MLDKSIGGRYMNLKTYLTAIARRYPAKPMRLLRKLDLLNGRLLDYGCGKGFDAQYYRMDAYDPYYAPQRPQGQYDVITCQYVLNVLEKEEEEKILEDIKNLLKDNGRAYLTVRRDIKDGYTAKGTYQRIVKLPLPILKENRSFCTYILSKEEAL